MATQIFNTTGALYKADTENIANAVYAKVKIGDSAPNTYPVTGTMGGQQLFRVQYDISANGTKYVLTAGRGKGAITFTIFEGPFRCGAEGLANFASQYAAMDAYKARKIEIVLPLRGNGADSSAQSTQGNAVFKGVIISADTNSQLDEESGEVYIKTKILAEGMWG